MKKYFSMLFLVLLGACSNQNENELPIGSINEEEENTAQFDGFYYGADLSYVNEMEDCGATYKNQDGVEKDPYEIFAEAGSNLARFRLWHNPEWTEYSNLEDVKKSISRAKAQNMEVLLDFHYSDDWADPAKQEIPAAWEEHIDDTETLGQLLYDYTYNTLNELAAENLLPEIVQVGNETNGMILQKGELEWPIDWERNAYLLNKGIAAVRQFSEDQSKNIEIMLHIAQPENGLWWFEQAQENGVTDFDWIGLSYYPIWSEYDIQEVGQPIKTLVDTYNKNLMIVETAYPFTFDNADNANNILGPDALVTGIEASPAGQIEYLNELRDILVEAGGSGIVYWEPAWVSTDCRTQWAQGSHWDNATLFDHNNQATIGMDFFNASSEE